MKKADYLSSLTSLRGIAALLVVIFHFDLIFFRLAAPNSPFFIRKGYLWVDLFFMLSGFIMMHVYGRFFSDGIKLQHLKEFFRARFARIYPLHLFSFLSVVVLYFWYRTFNEMNAMDVFTFNMKAIPTNLLLLHSMGFHSYLSWDTPSWSISTEWWVYVVFPFIIIPFKKIIAWKKRAVLLFILLGYFMVIYYLYPLSNAASPFPNVSGVYSLDVTYDYGFIRCFLGFLFGMLIYELYKIKWCYSYLSKGSSLMYATIAVKMPDFIPIILFASVVLMSAYAVGRARAFLNFKPLSFLGDISYSVYLMHMPILFFFLFLAKKYPTEASNTSIGVSWLYCLIFVGIVIATSTITYKFIEMPMRRKLNPLLQKSN
jgi:peptidoglycan/LPS O-acetylase OafA/YrhL